MRARLAFWVGIVCFFMVTSAMTKPKLAIYVYNNLYSGPYLIRNHNIYVNPENLADLLDLPKGYQFPTELQYRKGDRSYVLLKGVAALFGSKISVNWGTGIVDVYRQHPYIGGPVIIIPPSSEPSTDHYPSGSSMSTSNIATPADQPFLLLPYPYYGYDPSGHYPPYGNYYGYYYPPIQQVSRFKNIYNDPNIHWSNGVLPEDSQGHIVPGFQR